MPKEFKIVCTGNPNKRGLPSEIKKLYPETVFLSRATGYDLCAFDSETENKFRHVISDHNVFINHSFIHFGVQIRLLNVVAEEWNSGHVINFGSFNEHSEILTAAEPIYTEDKLNLRKLSLQLNNETFKTTHIVQGAFQSISENTGDMMHPKYIANTIKWILEQDFEIPIIGIQQSSDKVRNWIQQQKP